MLRLVFAFLVGLAGGRIEYVQAVRGCTATFTCLKVSSPSPMPFAPAEDKAERAVPAEKEETSRGCLVAFRHFGEEFCFLCVGVK